MAIHGPRSLLNNAIPTGVDGSEVFRISMQEGMTVQEVLSMAATVIGETNQELVDQYGGLIFLTERLYARYRKTDGSRSMTPIASEFKDPDGVRSANQGHMLPALPYKDATSWSVSYLEKAIREDLRDDVLTIKDRWRNRVDYDILTRMFTTTATLIGTAGYDAPWAIGTGTSIDFIPPQYMAYTFTSSHTHFLRVNAALSSTNAASTLETMAQELSHHGHIGDKVALVSESDLATYKAMDGKVFAAFKPALFTTIQGGSSPYSYSNGQQQGVPGETFGYYSSSWGLIELKTHPRIPAGYSFMTKSYGINNASNGLAIRVPKGFGLTIDPQVNRSLSPKLDYILFQSEHGVGVGDRTNGVCAQIASGGTTYTNPTIS